jgi:PKD repeat protein
VPGAGHRIVSYRWNFGSGSTQSGATVSRKFTAAGTFTVVLTVTDEVGQTAVAARPVVVAALGDANAAFTFSPAEATAPKTISFNASESRPSQGATITSYEWDFGEGGAVVTTTSAIRTNLFEDPGTYVVTLRITDSAGKTSLVTQTVTLE